LKHLGLTERVSVIRAQAHRFKGLYKDELIDLQCDTMLYSKLIFCNWLFKILVWIGRAKSFLRCRSAHLKLLYLFERLTFVKQGILN